MKSDKSHDMTKARRCRIIYGDEATLRVIGMLFPEAVNHLTYRSDELREVWDGTMRGKYKQNVTYVNVGPVTHGVFCFTTDEWKYLREEVLVKRKLVERKNYRKKYWDLV
jgi:hypothetical protein